MKTWDQFLRDVLPDVPGCPEPVAEHAILRAAQEFCQHTRAWNVWLDPVTTIGAVSSYDLNLEPRSELVRLESATLAGIGIKVSRVQDMPIDWRTNATGMGTCIFTVDSRTVQLLPIKAAGLSLVIQASLKPANDSEGLDDALYAQYVETIAMGAKARLMAHALKSYGNPGESATQRASFVASMDSIKTRLWRGNGTARPRAVGNFF